MKLRKMTAAVLSVSMLASLSGCALFDKDDEAVLAVADDYASAVAKVKVGDIIDLLVDGDEVEDSLNDLVTTDAGLYGEDYEAICNAIASTLSYEIDEESVESSKKNAEASVNVTYTLVDYDAVYETITDEGGDVDAFVDALKSDDADTQDISITLELVLEDDEWLVEDKNGKDIQKVYAFYVDAFDLTFAPALAEYVDDVIWYYADGSTYTNENTIELDIIPTSGEGEEITWEFYYEYYRDGQLIYTSDTCYDQGYWIEAYYGPGYDPAAELGANSCLVAGDYRCIIYDLTGNVLADSTCTVINEDFAAGMSMNDAIDHLEWYYSDNGVYVNYDEIELDIITTDNGSYVPFTFYYEYYIDGELVFTSGECEDQGHWIEAYYGPYYDDNAQVDDNGNLIPGEYRCVMYDMDGNVIADDTCTVRTN